LEPGLTLAFWHLIQDLKDYGRMGNNNILWADIDRQNTEAGYAMLQALETQSNRSVIAFPTVADAEEAIERLKGVDINGRPVTLSLAPVRFRRFMERLS